MNYQSIFKRYELKYILTSSQYKMLSQVMAPYMQKDKYPKSLIANIYYDTPCKILVKRSLEKPEYKEKLRVRSYGIATDESCVFVEVKKKYKGIVYKRRLDMPTKDAQIFLSKDSNVTSENQIAKEINYFKNFYYPLDPSAYIAYYRQAFFAKQDENFRITFDENIIYRDYDLSLNSKPYGQSLLTQGTVLMEIKTALGLPDWLLGFLSQNKIYKTSFSKYGSAYKDMLIKESGGINYVA